jgi:hypothetical protein
MTLLKLAEGKHAKRDRGCVVLIGAVLTLFFGWFTAFGIAQGVSNLQQGSASSFDCFMPCFGSTFLVLGLLIFGGTIWPWIAGLRAETPEITSSVGEIRVGDAFTVSYRQNFKQPADVRQVTTTLVFRETALYQTRNGMKACQWEQPAAAFEFPGRRMEAGGHLDFTQDIEIPRDGMHTFRARYNYLRWILKTKVDIAGWPDYWSEFEIPVAPSRAE